MSGLNLNRLWTRTKPGSPQVGGPFLINCNEEGLEQLTGDDGLLLMRLRSFDVLTDLAIVYGEAFDSAGWIDLELHDPDADPPQVETLHQMLIGEPVGTPPAWSVSTDPVDNYFVSGQAIRYGSRRRRELWARLTLGDGASLPEEGWADVYATYLPLAEWSR